MFYGCYFFIESVWGSSPNMVTPGGRPERRESGKRVPDRFVLDI